jgi:hypothetical protein
MTQLENSVAQSDHADIRFGFSLRPIQGRVVVEVPHSVMKFAFGTQSINESQQAFFKHIGLLQKAAMHRLIAEGWSAHLLLRHEDLLSVVQWVGERESR